MMKKYRRKPTEIEAVQWIVTHTPSDDAKPIVDFINKNGGSCTFIYEMDQMGTMVPGIHIETLEGTMRARPFDYICRGLKGEFWPVKPDIFEATNELIVIPNIDVHPAITLKEFD